MNIPPNPSPAKILKAHTANRLLADKSQPSKAVRDSNVPSPIISQPQERLKSLEPLEVPELIYSDPVFDTEDSATILGVAPSRLEKWRQRRQGPDFLQYQEHGSVLYELSSLIAFKAAHRIRPSRQPRAGRRRQG